MWAGVPVDARRLRCLSAPLRRRGRRGEGLLQFRKLLRGRLHGRRNQVPLTLPGLAEVLAEALVSLLGPALAVEVRLAPVGLPGRALADAAVLVVLVAAVDDKPQGVGARPQLVVGGPAALQRLDQLLDQHRPPALALISLGERAPPCRFQ